MNKAALILMQVLCLTVFVSAGTGLCDLNYYTKIFSNIHKGNITITYEFSASRNRRDTEEDIKDAFADADKEIQGFVQKFYGANCIMDSQCLEYVAYCDKKAGLSAAAGLGSLAVDGQCRPVIWVWIVLAVIVLLFLGTCICCCLCGLCSCLYK